MSRPVSIYPRQPTGPSGFGSAAVRRLQGFGGDYQRSHPDSRTTAIQSGDFSKVIVEGEPEYVTFAIDGSQSVIRDTMGYRIPFLKSTASKNIPGTLAYGPQGLYVTNKQTEFELLTASYTYEVNPGTNETVTFDTERSTMTTYRGGYQSKFREIDSYQMAYSYLPLTPGNTMFYRLRDEVAYWGRHPTFGQCFVSFSIARFGRVGVVHRPLSDITLIRHKERTETGFEEYRIVPATFTRPDAEFMWITPQIVLKDFTVGVIAETFFRPGPYVVGEDYRPKFWFVTTPNNGEFGTFTFNDVTASAFPDGLIPGVPGSGYYGVYAGRPYQFDLSATMYTMKVEAVQDNAFVVCWQQRLTTGWRQKCAYVTVSGGTTTVAISYESADQTTRGALEHWQCVTNLGDGRVLAKIVSGTPGINKDVKFRLSTDYGQSWGSEFDPIGFSAPLKNQYFGNFRTNKPAKDGAPGKVLIVSWDMEDSVYRVWLSEDNGSTWVRKSKIYKPSSFLRIDTMLAGDGGGNFNNLIPGPVNTRDLDETIPDRYKDRT